MDDLVTYEYLQYDIFLIYTLLRFGNQSQLSFFFLVDVSINAIQIGATFGAFSAISRFVNDLPVSSCFFQKNYNFLYFLRVNVLLICNNNNMIGVGGSSNTCGNYI